MSFGEQPFVKSNRAHHTLIERNEQAAPNVWYYGIASKSTSLETDPHWQIKRTYYTPAGVYEVTYADSGAYTNKWADRATYFTAPAIATIPQTTVQTSGLTIGGRIRVVPINDTTWTPLPAIPLPNRNQINMQNETGFNAKLNYDPLTPGYEGITVADGSERQYAIKDTILLYAKLQPGGSGSFTVEELA